MRESLSSPIILIAKWAFTFGGIPLVVMGVLSGAVPMSPEGFLGLAAVLAAIILPYPLTHVWIDGDYLYCRRLVKEIRVLPSDIADADNWWITSLIKISFREETELGSSVIFFPYVTLRNWDKSLIGAEAFQKIGQFCGWKTSPNESPSKNALH